jgi:HEAT repeat protein
MAQVSVHLLTLSLLPACLAAQSLQQQVAAVGTGTVHLSFAARPGVCGDGDNNISTRRNSDEWESDCDSRVVRVALRVTEHQVEGIRTYVGGRWRPGTAATDLGMVRPQEVAAYLVRLAGGEQELTGDPVLPATLADSVTIWPSLLRLARNSALPEERRRTAIFWLGQAAEAAAGRALDSIAGDVRGDREVRKQAVFALSQRSADEAVPALIRIARTSPDPELRKTALFWLGQSDDSRALDLFEEILR